MFIPIMERGEFMSKPEKRDEIVRAALELIASTVSTAPPWQ